MTETRKTLAQPYVRISYPVFEEESAQAQEMNAFFLAFADAVTSVSEEIVRRKDGIRILSADYKTKTEENRITVTYRITVRRRGRIECAQTLSYTWEEGALLLPEKKKNVLTKLCGRLTRRHG